MENSFDYLVSQTRNGQVGYCKLGHGRPLILVVGYSGTLYHWNKHFVGELAKHFTVYLVDNRKIGLSLSSNEYSMLGMAQDIVDFIEAQHLEKPLVFGWSMGGIIVQTILKNYPDLVSGAILLATVPHGTYTSPEFINLLANSDAFHPNEFRLKLYGMFFSETPRPELKDIITSAALTIKDYHYRFNFAAKELQDYAVVSWPGMEQTALNQVKVPVLVLQAKNDLVVSTDACQVFIRDILNSKLVIYSSGGHFFLHGNPLMVARDVSNFFTEDL